MLSRVFGKLLKDIISKQIWLCRVWEVLEYVISVAKPAEIYLLSEGKAALRGNQNVIKKTTTNY